MPADVKEIFLAAAALDQADRAGYLNQACGDNADLRKRVEALLQAHDSPSDSPATGAYASVASTEETLGTVIAGKYKLLELIGEGGMGSVWMAQQSEPVKRYVAVKLIKAGMDSKQVIARFEAERQALAVMDHPNIAKILDGGVTEKGSPYFVMELVKGVPITKYCDEHKLTPRQRLELFVPVCQAIQHAHQKGIIHRDVKPSNVMVAPYDDNPVPKVIDFGVAKATGQSLTDQTLNTGFGGIAGTPEYMSPEQATLNNLDIDTRSDIYSLGVLLYELLTGSPPFKKKELEKAGMLEILRVIREEEPPRPSTKLSTDDALPSLSASRGTEPKKLTGILRNELDWIVMKALEKNRARRYETANGFAADINRYLAGEPVQAHPPSASYRMKKFLRKNKGPVMAASFVGLALIGGIIGTGWGLVRADQARQRESERAEGERLAKEEAQTREAETKAVLEFVENKVFAAARPENQDGGLGRGVTLRKAVEAALPYLDKNFADRPLIEARLRSTLGLSFLHLGDAKIAAEQYQTASTLYTKHLGPTHPDTLTSMNNLTRCYDVLGRHADALKLRKETLELRRATLGADDPATLSSMHNLANSYLYLGRYPEAIKLHEETLALRKVKLGPAHFDTLMSMANLATSYAAVGRNADALKVREDALALQKASIGPDHPETLMSMHNLAISYSSLGRLADALKLFDETLELMRAKLGPNHPDTLRCMYNIAFTYDQVGRYADACKLHEETLALRKAKFGLDHPDTLKSMAALVKCLTALNRGAEAVPIIDDCMHRAAGQVVPRAMIPGLIEVRLRHFETTKDAAGCRTTAEMWEKLNRTDAASLYTAACTRAVTAAVFEKSAVANADRFAKEQSDLAMNWLKQAVAAGFKEIDQLKKDTDLDALRDREDFKKLVAELEKRAAAEKQVENKKPPEE